MRWTVHTPTDVHSFDYLPPEDDRGVSKSDAYCAAIQTMAGLTLELSDGESLPVVDKALDIYLAYAQLVRQAYEGW